MKKVLASIFAVMLTVFGLGAAPVYADGGAGQYIGDGTSSIAPDGTSTSGLMGKIKAVINVVIGLVGVVAVVMMIVGGLSFITSQGDASKVAKARNTILYGVVGLVVVILAFAIVNFVINNV